MALPSLLSAPAAAQPPVGPEPVGAVYIMTNSAEGNGVTVFQCAMDGTLTVGGTYPTRGLGAGGGLGNQGALVLSADDR
jgi:6-phosphogluconolactonase